MTAPVKECCKNCANLKDLLDDAWSYSDAWEAAANYHKDEYSRVVKELEFEEQLHVQTVKLLMYYKLKLDIKNGNT